MKIIILLLSLVLLSASAFSQNGLPDFAPSGGAQSLTLNINRGVAAIGTVPTTLPSVTIALVANTTNFVYVDLVLGVVTSNTTGFTATVYPVATALTNETQVISFKDVRPGAVNVTGTSSGGTGTVTSFTVAGTANQITVAGTCTVTTTGTCTLSLPSALTLPGTLNVTGNTTLNITGSTQCLHVNTSGVVSGTGSDCGSGGGGVSSVFGRTGAVVAVSGDYSVSLVTGAAPLASPTFSGIVTTPALTLSGFSTGCLTNTSGVVSSTGTACGGSGISGLTTGVIPQAGSSTTIVNSSPQLDNGVTTANTLTYAGSGGIAVTSAGPAGVLFMGQGTAQGLGTNGVAWTVPTTVGSYDLVLPSAAQTGYLKFSTAVNQTGCTASSTFMCGLFESNIDLTVDVGSTILPPANGGTGVASPTDHGIVLAHGTSAFTVIVCGDGTLVTGHTGSNPTCSATPVLGSAGAAQTGTLGFSGATSGTVTIQPQGAAGTWNFNLPTTAGSAGQVLTSQGGGSTAMTWTTGGTGTVTSAVIAGTASQITASGTCTITTSGTCTLSLPNAVILGTDNSAAGTLQLANSAANAHTIWGSGATTTNTIQGFATVPTTGDVIDCTVTSTTCLLHDAGFTSANIVRKDAANTGAAAMTLDMSASTSAAAHRLPNIAGASSTTAGVLSYDATNKNFHGGANSVDNILGIIPSSISPANNDCVKWSLSSGVLTLNTAGAACGSGGSGTAGANLFSTTGSTTVTAASATTLIGSVSGSTTVAANTWTTGSVMEVLAQGFYTTPVTARTLTIDLKIGGTTRITTGAATVLASVTNGVWRLRCGVTTRTTGASGTQIANCIFEMTGATLTAGEVAMQTSSTWTIDTTAGQAIDLQATWDSTTGSPTITSTNIAAWIPGAPVTGFSGDGTLISNSGSTGAITATLANAAANTVFGNATGSSAAPGYTTNPSVTTITTSGQTIAAGIKDTSASYLTSAMSQQTTATCTNVTGMSWNIAANKTYKLHCDMPITFVVSATIAACLGGPGTATSFTLMETLATSASAVQRYDTVNQTAYGTKTTASAAPGAVTRTMQIDAMINNGSTASGTALTVQTAANGTNGFTILADSVCQLTQIGN